MELIASGHDSQDLRKLVSLQVLRLKGNVTEEAYYKLGDVSTSELQKYEFDPTKKGFGCVL